MAKPLLRLLAVLLLAVVVPVQGMASVATGQCMVLGHHQDQEGGDMGHAATQDGAHEHDHAATDDDGENAHCGPCVACCASASIAGSTPSPVIAFSSNTKYVFSQAAPPGVAPHRLDRPPLAL